MTDVGTITIEGCVYGYHYYLHKCMGASNSGEQLECEQESDNSRMRTIPLAHAVKGSKNLKGFAHVDM